MGGQFRIKNQIEINMSSEIKSQIKTITPEWAASVIAKLDARQASGSFLQRRVNEGRVKQYASEIKNGYWIVNGDAIRFNDEGDLIDGQTRLRAVIHAGIPIQSFVITGLPKEHKNGILINTMDTIDRGRPRSTGSQLQISHGYQNANNYAAAARGVVGLINGVMNTPVTTGQVLFILGIYRHNIEAILGLAKTVKLATTSILAPFAMYHASDPGRAQEFAMGYFNLENLKPGSPILALSKWRRNHMVKGGADRAHEMGVVCSCLSHFHQGNSIQKAYYNQDGINWLLTLQKSNVRKIREVMSTASQGK